MSMPREELFKLLSNNPKDVKSRIGLAKSFFEDGYYDFCIRELNEVSSESEEVVFLIGRIKTYLGICSKTNSDSSKQAIKKTLAEIEV